MGLRGFDDARRLAVLLVLDVNTDECLEHAHVRARLVNEPEVPGLSPFFHGFENVRPQVLLQKLPACAALRQRALGDQTSGHTLFLSMKEHFC